MNIKCEIQIERKRNLKMITNDMTKYFIACCEIRSKRVMKQMLRFLSPLYKILISKW
jgi:hypothetical protein